MPDKTSPETTAPDEATEAIAEALVEASGDTAPASDLEAPEAPAAPAPSTARSGSFLGRHWVSLVLAVALVAALGWGFAATRDAGDWEATAGELTAELTATTTAKDDAEAQVVTLTTEKEDLQGDLDECRATVDASEGLLAVNDEAGTKLGQFVETLGLVMAAATEAEFNQHYATMETQQKELDEISSRFDAAEKTYTESTGLCKD